ADRDHDDGNRGGGLLGREACWRAEGCNNVHRATNERRSGLGESLRRSVAIRIVEGDVLAFEVTEIAQPRTEGVPLERVVDNADVRDLPHLLRACRERPRCRAAEERDELATFHRADRNPKDYAEYSRSGPCNAAKAGHLVQHVVL